MTLLDTLTEARHSIDSDTTGGVCSVTMFFVTLSPRYRLKITKFKGPSRYIIDSILESWLHSTDNTDYPSTSPPEIIEDNVSPCWGMEKVIWIRLPRYFVVELANIFVFDVCICWEFYSNYSFTSSQEGAF